MSVHDYVWDLTLEKLGAKKEETSLVREVGASAAGLAAFSAGDSAFKKIVDSPLRKKQARVGSEVLSNLPQKNLSNRISTKKVVPFTNPASMGRLALGSILATTAAISPTDSKTESITAAGGLGALGIGAIKEYKAERNIAKKFNKQFHNESPRMKKAVTKLGKVNALRKVVPHAALGAGLVAALNVKRAISKRDD